MMPPVGLVFLSKHLSDVESDLTLLGKWLSELGLEHLVEQSPISQTPLGDYQSSTRLNLDAFARLTPNFDTLEISSYLLANVANDQWNLAREILVSLLASPFAWKFSSFDSLRSAIRVRENIVHAAKNTALNFHTSEAERPEDMWTYKEETGFIILPGTSLIDALVKATQPGISGTYYSFSCYRATEYVILLALAQEAAVYCPSFYQQLQKQWETKAIMSGRFHDVFLIEYGSMDDPLPINYYVPGDRVWFRNPDDRSSDVEGFEGSWVFYLGNGMFPNFWKLNQPFTLQDKCLEVFHWRDGVVQAENDVLAMDESVVEREVALTKLDPERSQAIMNRMYRLRDPKGVYADGGCIDATRESPRALIGNLDLIKLDI